MKRSKSANICVPKFVSKSYAEKYGVDEDTITKKLKLWIEINDSPLPSSKKKLKEVESFLEGQLCISKSPHTAEDYEDIHKLWEKYQKMLEKLPAEGFSKEDVENNTRNLLKYFKEDEFLFYTDDKGVIKLRIKEPVLVEKEVAEETEETSPESPFEEAEALVERLISDSEKYVRKSKDFNSNHTYEILEDGKWVPVDTSVTQLVSKAMTNETTENTEVSELWKIPSTALGNTVDAFVRDYFMGKDVLDGHIPNLTIAQAQALKEDLDTIKKSFDTKFGKGKYKVVTQEFPIAGTYTEMVNGKPVTKTIAGTMDMLVYDDKGNFYIYDMKTVRSSLGSDKLTKYSQQLSYYKSILEANYPEIRGKIKELNLIRFDLRYEDPRRVTYTVDNHGVLYANKMPISRLAATKYRAPRLHTEDSIVDGFVPIDVEAAINDIEALPKSSDPITNSAAIKEVVESSKIPESEKSEIKKKWKNSKYFTPSQKLYLSNLAMNLASDIVTQLSKDPNANEFFFKNTYKKVDFTKMSRTEIIETVLDNLFDAVKERYFSVESALERGLDGEVLKGFIDVEECFESLLEDAYARFILLENYSIVRLKLRDTITTEGYDEQLSQDVSDDSVAEREREYYQMGFRQISAKAGLSSEIRRFFEGLKIPIKDDNGNIIEYQVDDTFKLPVFVDSNVAVNSILEWCSNCTTMAEMEAKLREMASTYDWVNPILDAIKEEPFRSKFFNNFKKDFSQYSIVYIDYDSKGNQIYVTKTINTKSGVETIMDGLKASFKEGLMSSLLHTKDTLEGRGYIDSKVIAELQKQAAGLRADFSKVFMLGKGYPGVVKKKTSTLTNLLISMGLAVNVTAVQNTIIKDGSKRNFEATNTARILGHVDHILAEMAKHTDKNEQYNPIINDKDGDSGYVYSDYSAIVKLMSPHLLSGIEASTYQNGKMYYSYTVPSYLQRHIKKLKGLEGTEKFYEYLEENFEYDEFFYNEETGYLNGWLERLKGDASAREVLDHKVQLNFNGTDYRDLSELGYTLSLIQEYFYDRTGKLAWFRTPTMSNKPSSEFIRFYKDSSRIYKTKLASKFQNVALQEIIRIQGVLQAAANNNITPIENFNISKRDMESFKAILDKVRKGEPLTHTDLVSEGKWILSTGKDANGASFKFLKFLNQHLINDTELGKMILDKINGKVINESAFSDLFKDALIDFMKDKKDSEMAKWQSIGLFDTVTKTIKDENGERTHVKFKYVDNLHKTSWESAISDARTRLSKDNPAVSEKEIEAEALNTLQSEVEANLENYMWNDAYATTQIIQLTVTDLAYYKNEEDFQKRYAQVHSPTMKLNIDAVMLDGKTKYSDGKCRTMYIKDEIITSEIVENVAVIFDDLIKQANDAEEAASLRHLKEEILDAYKKVNVTDGQAYVSITAYRKKLGMVGKWGEEEEKAYDRIVKGNFNLNDLNVLWTPFKPFVYTQLRKTTGTKVRPMQKVAVQQKNSEYLILLADALLRGKGKKTALGAIFDFMESTAYNGTEHNNSTYNARGIDAILFESNVKSGLQGGIDINGLSYNDIIKTLNEKAYYNEDHTPSADNDNDVYDDCYVHTFDFNDYGFQQEVPAHLVDHEQLMGSQSRILSISDFLESELDTTIPGMGKLTVRNAINEYQELIAQNIRDSYKQLVKDMKLNSKNPYDKEKAIADLLYETIVKDQRYGGDLIYACQLDKGKFVIPLNDPIQAVRVQQLLNSIIKSRINKQTVTGGPVVQATSYGLSEDLHCVFKDKDGNALLNYTEFCKENKINPENGSKAYHKYVADNQGSFSHMEILMPVPSEEMRKALTLPDGSLMSVKRALKEGIITEDALKAICYRIPTEDKYSILPCKVVGFTTSAEEVVMMPKEVTTLTGSDFDIDKMYIMLKALTNVDGKFVLDKSPKYWRNNRVFDIMYGLLTHPATARKMFNPGSFNVQKRAARITTLLENGYNYNDIKGMSLSELNNEVGKLASQQDIIFSSSQVYFHKQNMTAAKLIGIFANNNTSHAFLSLQDIRLNIPTGEEFTFDGIQVSDNMKLDNITALDGHTLISKTIAGYLAASVDAVKDPVLNFMNLNTMTAGPAMVLARLGFDVESIALFLTQPLIKQVTREYFRLNNEGYISVEDLVDKVLSSEEYKGQNIELHQKDLINTSFTKEEMADEISNPDVTSEYQIRALLLLKKLATMSKSLNTITFLTKFNSTTNAPGPMISDNLVMEERYNKFLDDMHSLNPPFKPSAALVIRNSPILSAFYESTLGDYGACEKLFAPYFYQYSDKFKVILSAMRNYIKSNLDSDTIDKMVNFFILYKLSTTNFMIGNKKNADGSDMTAEEARDYYVNDFPREFKDKIAELGIGNNSLIRIITFEGKTKKCPIPTLQSKTGSYSIDMQEQIKAAWTDLIQSTDPKVQQLGKDLFLYNLYRSGFQFNPKTFLHLASTDVKLLMDNYVELIREPNSGNDNIDTMNFIVQFLRNYSFNRKLVPELKEDKNLKISNSKDRKGNKTLVLTFDSKGKGISSIVTQANKEGKTLAPIIQYDGNIYYRQYEEYAKPIQDGDTEVTYTLTSPLGIQNDFIEIDGTAASGIEVNTVIAPGKSRNKESVSKTKDEASNTSLEDYDIIKNSELGDDTNALLKRAFAMHPTLLQKYVEVGDKEHLDHTTVEQLKVLEALVKQLPEGKKITKSVQEWVDKLNKEVKEQKEKLNICDNV